VYVPKFYIRVPKVYQNKTDVDFKSRPQSLLPNTLSTEATLNETTLLMGYTYQHVYLYNKILKAHAHQTVRQTVLSPLVVFIRIRYVHIVNLML